jgi:hypothetical protein
MSFDIFQLSHRYLQCKALSDVLEKQYSVVTSPLWAEKLSFDIYWR